MSGTYGALLGVYTDAFTSGWQQAMATAAYKFRTTDSTGLLTAALADVSGYAKTGDTLLDNIDAGKVTGKAAETQFSSLELLLNAKVQAIGPLVAGVETFDSQNLKKAASLDQPGLKTLAATLKSGVDATLLTNLSTFTEALTAALVAAILAASKSTPSTADTEKSMAAVVKEFDLSDQKITQSELDENNKLSGAPTPYWLDTTSQSTSTT